MTIDELCRRAGLALGCDGLAERLTPEIPPGQVPAPGFPGGDLIGAPDGSLQRRALIRFPAAHIVMWCNAQAQSPQAPALFSTFLKPGAAPVETDHD